MTLSRQMIALGFAGALVATMAAPSDARDRWVGPAVAGAAGFAAGAAIGAAAAAPSYGYGYYEPGPNAYDYGPGPYAYGGAAYAYREPAYVYGGAAYAYGEPDYGNGGTYMYDNHGPRSVNGQCFVASDSGRGYGYWGACQSRGKDTGVAEISGQAGSRVSRAPLNR